MHEWHIYPDFTEASKQTAEFLAEKIQHVIDEKGACHIILPGGNTPAESLGYLATKSLDWDKIHWYLGDERCLPSLDPERNDLMLYNNLWSKIGSTHIYRIPTELGAKEAAAIYRNVIKDIERFDIAYLGMGEDGHTASLFPQHEALDDHRSVIPVSHSPKPPSDRVSLSLVTLSKAKIKIVLVSGQNKAGVIKRIKEGESLPVNRIGDINWFIDEAANTTEI